MNSRCRRAAAGLLLAPILLLSGCLSSTRKLPVPKLPVVTETLAPDKLVDQLNQAWADLNTLTAKVDIQASLLKPKEGLARDITSFGGIILIRKPEMLRVYGKLPVIGSEMFDMVSDGKNFTMYVPHYNKVYKGSNKLKKKSEKFEENMRPGFFFDAMVVRGLDPGDLYEVTADTSTVEDTAKKNLYLVPEYVLSIMRPKPGSQQLTPVRVITFHRDDLMPHEQDLYDSDGNLETQVVYENYRVFDSARFPSTITIRRPLEDYQIVLTVDSVKENQPLKDDQFQITNIPEGTNTQKLE
jgi:outer membrane lipoprotein-sorting protein